MRSSPTKSIVQALQERFTASIRTCATGGHSTRQTHLGEPAMGISRAATMRSSYRSSSISNHGIIIVWQQHRSGGRPSLSLMSRSRLIRPWLVQRPLGVTVAMVIAMTVATGRLSCEMDANGRYGHLYVLQLYNVSPKTEKRECQWQEQKQRQRTMGR